MGFAVNVTTYPNDPVPDSLSMLFESDALIGGDKSTTLDTEIRTVVEDVLDNVKVLRDKYNKFIDGIKKLKEEGTLGKGGVITLLQETINGIKTTGKDRGFDKKGFQDKVKKLLQTFRNFQAKKETIKDDSKGRLKSLLVATNDKFNAFLAKILDAKVKKKILSRFEGLANKKLDIESSTYDTMMTDLDAKMNTIEEVLKQDMKSNPITLKPLPNLEPSTTYNYTLDKLTKEERADIDFLKPESITPTRRFLAQSSSGSVSVADETIVVVTSGSNGTYYYDLQISRAATKDVAEAKFSSKFYLTVQTPLSQTVGDKTSDTKTNDSKTSGKETVIKETIIKETSVREAKLEIILPSVGIMLVALSIIITVVTCCCFRK